LLSSTAGARGSRHAPAAAAQRILAPGRNCWRIAHAERAAVLIDASSYYARLEQALGRARRSILIVGWDFDGRIRLCPEHEDCPPLGDFLRTLVEGRPELQIHILVWSLAVVHAPSAPIPLLAGAPWQSHPRISLRLDHRHPFYAAHHQKIVCIDDALAFVGGIDLTVRRWDTCGHREADRHRTDPGGHPYRPVHDVQMMVDGAVAGALSELARQRWGQAAGEELVPASSATRFWPDDLAPDFVDVPVAIGRTAPELADGAAVHEVMALTADMLAAARRSIYIETQYFTARFVRDALEKSLAAATGPEIVVVVTRASSGILERFVMGKNRDRMVRRLRRVDRHGRLRVFHALVPGSSGPCDVHMHAKVLIIDDTILRIGSSNLNNRSAGLDTECDLAIEAHDRPMRRAIARIRERLLAEHLDVTAEAVASAVAGQGSLIRGIEKLNRNRRGLAPLADCDVHGPTRAVLGTSLLDPSRPFEPRWLRRALVPRFRSS
jgi:phosphatidylserine/phosphatidylglycerophosphate/cardiolipin synthase-like enzyme